MKQTTNQKHLSDALLILWAGGAALLSYSLVYALRKPYTAASFEGLTFMGSDYKVAVTTIQILGYVIAKFFGIGTEKGKSLPLLRWFCDFGGTGFGRLRTFGSTL